MKQDFTTELIGISLILLYCIISSAGEVYMGRVFQDIHPIFAILAAFALTKLIFVIIQIGKIKKIISLVRANRKDILLLNITTALSWFGFFTALKYIEPVIVSNICLALPPIITALFWRCLRPQAPILKGEMLAAAGIFASTMILLSASMAGKSAVGHVGAYNIVLGFLLSFFSTLGVVGNATLLKKMSERGFDAKNLMVVRFYLLIIVAACFLPQGLKLNISMSAFLTAITFITIFAVIAPVLTFQFGIERCEPITALMLMSTVPLFTYLMEYLDDRLVMSNYSLGGTLVCVGFAAVGVVSRVKGGLYEKR